MQLLGRHGEVPQITELCLLGPVTRPGAAGAQKAILATRRRSLQMVLRLLAAAEPWLGNRLDDYLRDPDEYRAITRHLLHLGGTITSTPRVITVTLDTPAAPRITRALGLLIEEINAAPPCVPGDTRPITYQLATHPRI
jgi:hypothetical protein